MVVANQIKVRRFERVQEIVFGLVAVHLREDERDLRFRRQGLDGLERLVRDPDGAAVRVVGGKVKGVLQIEEHKDATRGGEGLSEAKKDVTSCEKRRRGPRGASRSHAHSPGRVRETQQDPALRPQ